MNKQLTLIKNTEGGEIIMDLDPILTKTEPEIDSIIIEAMAAKRIRKGGVQKVISAISTIPKGQASNSQFDPFFKAVGQRLNGEEVVRILRKFI